MPYLKASDKAYVDEYQDPVDPGQLTYALTKVVLKYLSRCGQRFATYAEAVAALECAKLELYRRQVAVYEDDRCAVNGDVYPIEGLG